MKSMRSIMKRLIKSFAYLIRAVTVPLFLGMYWGGGDDYPNKINKMMYIRNHSFYKELVQCIYFQKIIRLNSHVPWPVHFTSVVLEPVNIHFDKRYVRNFMAANCYWQAIEPIIFKGKFLVAQGVSFITQNHDVYNITEHEKTNKPIIIGENCLISLNSVILPGVELGDNTIVAANSVVNRSFPEGNVVIAGAPAKVVRRLDPEQIANKGSDNV